MAFFLGTNGNDFIIATAENDTILLGNGTDVAFGLDGNDFIDGGDGNDFLRGGNGQNALIGGAGDDTIDGGKDTDFINGGSGSDAIRGGGGNDRLQGGDGNDAILGEGGDDSISGGAGDDVIDGDSVLQVVALMDDNRLVRFDPNTPGKVTVISVQGITGTAVGLDQRTADGQFYLATTTGQIYTLDIITGQTRLVSSTNRAIAPNSGVDFNPVPDRLRIVTANGENLRINVDNGTFTVDRPVGFASGDVNAGLSPNVVGTAYTNNFPPSPAPPGSPATIYNLDSKTDSLLIQGGLNFPRNPGSPNDGVLTTVGKLGVDIQGDAGFDINSLPNGVTRAVAAIDSTFYAIDLLTGQAINLGQIGDGTLKIKGLSVAIVPNPLGGNDQIFGDDGNDILRAGVGNDFIDGGTGNDVLLGEAGDDRLFGRDGDDVLQGGSGNNELDGGNGNDLLVGGEGRDIARGGNGSDGLNGLGGDDELNGNDGDDIVDGGDGNDVLFGENGNDNLRGGRGQDTLHGGAGNDAILGEAGNDLVFGGDGDDSIDGDGQLRLYTLGANNTLVVVDPAQLGQTTTLSVTGVQGTLRGLDVRPEDGLLYAVSDADKIYTLDYFTGAATEVSTLNLSFFNGQAKPVGFDFNPVARRLRLVAGDETNFRINVVNGQVADNSPNPGIQPDTPLAYVASDVNVGRDPNIIAVAYTNSFATTTSTQLFGIDSRFNTLVLLPTPNNGGLQTIAALTNTATSQPLDVADDASFDILSSPNGMNVPLLLSGGIVYQLNLTTGAAQPLGPIGSGTLGLQGLAIAVVPDPTQPSDDSLFGGNGNDILNGNLGNDALYGEAGNDTLIGGAGNDLLVGGDGSDSFVFSSNRAFQPTDFGVDRLLDFQAGVDKLVLSQTAFGPLTPDQIAFVTSDDLVMGSGGAIVYSQASGNLFFNQNVTASGLGSGGVLAQLNGVPNLSRADFALVP